MFEYIFLHQALAKKFTSELARLGASFESRDDEFGFIVGLPEDLDESLVERADELYETLFNESESYFEGEEQGTQAAALNITLSDGSITQASVRPALMNKILAALSFEELNELVEAIADSVEHPDPRPFCQR